MTDDTDHIDWDILAEERLGQRPRATQPAAPARSSPATEALSLLKDYEQWEADIILENKCWTGQNVQLTDELYERMIELQTRRNNILRATQPAASAQFSTGIDSLVEQVASAIDEAVAKWQPGSDQRIKDAAARAAIAVINGAAQTALEIKP